MYKYPPVCDMLLEIITRETFEKKKKKLIDIGFLRHTL